MKIPVDFLLTRNMEYVVNVLNVSFFVFIVCDLQNAVHVFIYLYELFVSIIQRFNLTRENSDKFFTQKVNTP